MPSFTRIAIVNRGEAAMRLIHAVRDHNARWPAGDPRRMHTIAFYTDADARSAFVREADEAYLLGQASERPYLDLGVLERALRDTRAEAAWVGWGFVAEDPAFAELCAQLGVIFIGPSAQAMRSLGDKIGAKLLAEEVGVPVAPWSGGPVANLQQAEAATTKIGFPLMLKASAGGGGRGIRKIDSAAELAESFQRTVDEAERAFGSGVVFLEKLVSGARHVEVQLIADGQGTAWAVGVRDCSIQRRNQKVIEESCSPLLNEQQTAELMGAAERLALAVGYAGAGTVEFLYHPDTGEFAFLEVNTRLQVEHPITEQVTGLDLVGLQLQIAAGQPLTGERPSERGHAVEARLNAEDPDRDFAPAPGKIERLELPTGPGIRVDTGVAEGDRIPADFDSMIAKIIAHGADRAEALARLRRAILETTVVIDGGTTNKSFVLELLDQPEVTGPFQGPEAPRPADTGWIDRVRQTGRLVTDHHAGIALVAAAVEAYEAAERTEIARFLSSAQGGRPQLQHEPDRSIELKLRGITYQVTVGEIGPGRHLVTIGSGGPAEAHTVIASLEHLDEVHARLEIADRHYRLVTATHGPIQLVEVDGIAHRVSHDEGGVLRAPAPALVVSTPVAAGDHVRAGDPVLVLESMKMETVLPAAISGRVKELLVRTGTQVETGAPLLRLEPTGESETPEAGHRIELDLPAFEPDHGSAAERTTYAIAQLRDQLLGYDPPPEGHRAILRRYLTARDERADQSAAILPEELRLLDLFTDLAELSRNVPAGEDRQTELRVHSPREYFHTYLHSLDPEREQLPAHFQAKLLGVLAHYGIADFERTPQLAEAMFRISLAQQRGFDLDIAVAILQRWLIDPAPDDALAIRARATLERMVQATQRRFPVVGDLARSIRFRWFDQAQVDAERRQVLDGVAAEVAALVDPNAPDREERIAALTAIPEQLVGFARDRMSDRIPTREPLLEVLLRRHYREYNLHDLTVAPGDRPIVTAEYVSTEHGSTRLISAVADAAELTPNSSFTRAIEDQLTTDHDNVIEIYLRCPRSITDSRDGDEISAELAKTLAELPFAMKVRRVSVATCPVPSASVDYFTFRPIATQGRLVEDDLVRGMHPMVGRRLNLWRLRDFTVTRLEAPDNVLLYECVAQANPQDRRLLAMAQVRQVAVVRDATGRVIAVPHAERAIENCLEAIRRVRTERGRAGTRLDMNHVWVTVWPIIDADVDQLTALQSKITPLSEGAGIEEVLAQGWILGPDNQPAPLAIRFGSRPGAGVIAEIIEPPQSPLAPMDDYAMTVQRARRRGLVYPYELVPELTRGGQLTEYDLDSSGSLVPIDRPYGRNTAGIIVAVVSTPTELYPDGITRVVLCGDPTKALGALSEAESRRVIAAIDLAEQLGVPLEWFAVSAGARVSMDSGTENMDWVASALKRIVEFTQAGGEINIVVAGINVGAQPYWNAEATMLMHTKGILVMTPDSAMVLTGKQSLDFSGGVSAEDNYGIGGYDRVMGPNGQAQYWAPDLPSALGVLMAHYEHTWVAPGENGPRRAPTADDDHRDITQAPHEGGDFGTVGEIFSETHNPDRKRPFDIRSVMRALADVDHELLERWAGMAEAETAVVADGRIAGHSVCLIGIESKPVPRRGFPPADGPDAFTAGTLFPRSSKKVARALNAASGNRPVVVLANLSGFDGSPESMRNLQLEYGAQIGRAMVNFDGPIVFCVISRYHGGAFVVFSKRLNPQMTVLAVEGSYASVLGGAPAAAVVFATEVKKRAAADPRIGELEAAIDAAGPSERGRLWAELADLRETLHAEKIAEIAAEFDGVHNIHRAVAVGSVDEVITAAQLRPKVIEAIEHGIARDAHVAKAEPHG